jgi:rare lipoprotein A
MPMGKHEHHGLDLRRIACAAVLGVAVVCAWPAAVKGDPHHAAGIASIYAYKKGKTANGEFTNAGAFTAAHRTLPFGTKVRVTNARNRKNVVVRINDRGPFIKGRVIDVTPVAARALGFSGLTRVTLKVVN